ncbi:MAG: dihydroorotase [Clostridia bacterium]|nr:dihydroorotase [Clostridia bacterium]
MRNLLKNAMIWSPGGFEPGDLLVENGVVAAKGPLGAVLADRVLDCGGCALFPGFADVHVHLREPGFSYKETIATGTRAAARGGYTVVCAMPNLNPPPDSPAHLALEEKLIAEEAVIRVLPFGAITLGQRGEGETVDIAALAGRVCGFSDDGRGIKTAAVMREAMVKCRAADSLISAHCENLTHIPEGAGIHAGSYAARHGLPGIPSSSEWEPIRRDIELCRETGCRYHVCHVSARESVALIRAAKREGVDITCETAPHYLLLTEDDLPGDPSAPDAGRFKMNPPLRAAADRDALLEGLLDGTIDCIATDHAPHSAEEKAKGLSGSAMGIVGIETAFPLLYTELAETGRMPLNLLIDALALRPRKRFRLGGGIEIGDQAELTVFDLHADETIQPEAFLSMGRATPFAGRRVHAACQLTMTGERIAYLAEKGRVTCC